MSFWPGWDGMKIFHRRVFDRNRGIMCARTDATYIHEGVVKAASFPGTLTKDEVKAELEHCRAADAKVVR